MARFVPPSLFVVHDHVGLIAPVCNFHPVAPVQLTPALSGCSVIVKPESTESPLIAFMPNPVIAREFELVGVKLPV